MTADPIKTTGSAADPAVYEAFLSACRPVEGPALAWLTKVRYIAEEVVIALGLRFCGREYKDIMDALTIRFGKDAEQNAPWGLSLGVLFLPVCWG